MEFRSLGRSGLLVSKVGVGASNFGRGLDAQATARVVDTALDLGVTLFDTAAVYSDGRSEETLGAALRKHRQDVVIATKWGQQGWGAQTDRPYRGGSRDVIMKSVEGSLRRLQTDYIDLFQFHQPDLLTPSEETVRALDDLVRQGKVRYLGVSNLPAWRTVELQFTAERLGGSAFVSCQEEYSLLARKHFESEKLPMMQAHGLGLLPYTALASGLLTGKYRRGEAFPEGSRFATTAWGRAVEDRNRFTSETCWDVVEGLTDFAAQRGHTILELAYAWLLANPIVSSVITGAMTPEQIKANVESAAWTLAPEDLAEIDRITRDAP